MRTRHLPLTIAVLLSSAVILNSIIVSASGAPGDFDETFGPGGAIQTPTNYLISPHYFSQHLGLVIRTTVLAVQSDGKILVASAGLPSSTRMILRRYHANGTEDLSFGLSGEAVAYPFTPVEFVYGVPRDIKVQPDGKIVVAGYIISSGERRFRVWRFTSGGLLDTSFGNEGIVTRFSSSDTEARALGLLNGNIIVAASNDTVTCISTSGANCSSFGLLSYIGVSAKAIAVLARSGKFLTAGAPSQGLRRYNANGQLDSSFGNNGVATICYPAGYANEVIGIEVQSNGNIVIGTNKFYYQTGVYTYSIARLTSSGAIDDQFGENGCLHSGDPTVPGYFGKLQGFRVQVDGKIVALEGNHQYNVPEPNYNLIRYDINGSPDSTFISTGTLPRNQDLLVQPSDGKILTVGNDVLYSQNSWLYKNFYLARYLSQ